MKIILLVDPIQALVGSSAAFDGAASALLREAITRGDVQCLGASTDVIFDENVASDQSLAPLFAGIEMQEAADTDQSNEDTKADDSAKTSDASKLSAGVLIGDNILTSTHIPAFFFFCYRPGFATLTLNVLADLRILQDSNQSGPLVRIDPNPDV